MKYSKLFDKIVNPNNQDEIDYYQTSKVRVYIIIVCCCIVALVLVLKLLWILIFDADNNKKAALESRTISYKTAPKRGTIYDRNGNVLAYSKEAKTIYANPSQIENVDDTAQKLANILGGNISEYKNLIQDKSKNFVYIKRRFDKDKAIELNNLKINGLYLEDDFKREYPYGQGGGQIIGACNFDGYGLSGLELYYDDVLKGSVGKTQKEQGLEGMPIPGAVIQDTKQQDGQDIMVSLDIELQQKVEQQLVEKNSKLSSTSMSCIVENPKNGEIYASASLPLLNPNDISNCEQGATDLKSISSLHEPGSTFKTVASAAILENNALTPESEIYCPSSLAANEYWVSDVHQRASQTMTFRKILADSSNVGISLATSKLGFDKFYDKILKYKITEKSQVDFPGDTKGNITEYSNWTTIQAYNISFGQGIGITPIQLTKFYSAIENDGRQIAPHFLIRYLQSDHDEQYDEEDIIENKQALPVLKDMLRSVVTDGTGKNADIPGYGVIGKTGTGEIANEQGKYYSGKYFDSFVGILDNSSNPLVCYVGADDAPSDTNVTDTFHDIMLFAIERFKIIGK